MTNPSVGDQEPPEGDATVFVQSLARGLAVLRAFDAEHPQLRATEVAERASVTRAAARRFLLTLVDLGYITTDGHLYRLTPRVLELGGGYLAALRLDEIALPHLKSLSASVGESVSAASLDGEEIVYVARSAGRRIMSVNISVGTRFPAYATALGRVLIASLPQSDWDAHLGVGHAVKITSRTVTGREELHRELALAREQGWAQVDGELEDGLMSIAVPVHLGDEGVLAINVALGPVKTRPELTRDQIIEHLRAAGASIEADARAIRSRA